MAVYGHGGSNYHGQLGDGTNTDRTTPVQVGGFTNIEAIAAGDCYTVALKKNGTVWTWGSNLCGELGDGTYTDRTTPVQVLNLTDVTAIAAGDCYTVALKRDRTVWAWGINWHGWIGQGGGHMTGTECNGEVPVQVPNLTDVTAIAAGHYHTIALRSDGTVLAWGNNEHGQLGDGSRLWDLVQVIDPGSTGFFNLYEYSPFQLTATIATEGRAPARVTFHATGISARIYEWDFYNDGSADATTYDNRISYTFRYEGDYTVKVTAFDFDGIKHETWCYIKVLPSEEANEDISFVPFHPSSDSTPTKVMQGGKAVRWYRVLDNNNQPVKGKKIYYSFNRGSDIFSADIDDQGFVSIETLSNTDDGSYSLIITDKNGDPLDIVVNNIPTFNVVIKERKFLEEYKLLLGKGATVGPGGPGAKVGPLELKTVEAGLRGAENVSTKIALHTTGNDTDMEVENLLGSELGIDGFAGLFGKTWGVKTMPIGIGAGVAMENTFSTTYNFPDFFDTNRTDHDDQLIASAALFFENVVKGGHGNVGMDKILSAVIDRVTMLESYKKGLGNALALKGNGSAGIDIALKNPLGFSAGSLLGINLSAFDGEYIYERGDMEDFDGVRRTTQAVTTNLDIGSFSFSIAQQFEDDKHTPNFNTGDLMDTALLKIAGEKSITLETAPDGNVLFDFQHLINRTGEDGYFLTSTTEDVILSFKTDNPDTITEIAGNSDLVSNMLNGANFALKPSSYKKTYESILEITTGLVEWEEIKKDVRLISIPFDIEISAGLKLGLHLNIEGVAIVEYIARKGLLSAKKGFITTQIYEKDRYITNHLRGPLSVISEYVKVLKPIVSDIFDTVNGVVEAGKELIVSTAEEIGEAGAQLKAGANSIISGTKLHISKLSPFRGTYHIRAISKRAAYSEALEKSTASTIGDVFIVNVTDENNNLLSEFTTPLELEIDYTEIILQNAGFSLEKESQLRIYRWDEESGCYQLIGGSADTANKKVISPITLSGQYILAIDELAPEVSAFKISDGTPEPAITFAVNDTIGEINPALFSLKIDGIEVVNSTNYNDYLNVNTGLFTYQLDKELSSGEHTATIQTGDFAGNAKQYIYTFTVNNTPPTIDHTPITETTAEAPLFITATVTDDEGIIGVFLHYRGKTNEMPYIITEMKKSEDSAEYSAAIPKEYITSFGARYYIKTIDITGNETAIDPVDVFVQDNTGPKIIGYITITADPDGFIVRWEEADAIDTLGYMVYLGDTIDTFEPYEDTSSSTWILITGLEDNCYVTVSGYDAAGNKGELLEPVKIQLHKPGDVNNDKKIDLADVILSLQVSVRMTPATGIIHKETDINGDGRIGIEEAAYGLQWIVGLRPQTTGEDL